jgi:DNA-binding response OmpR family regulator
LLLKEETDVQGKKILVIDDDIHVRTIIERAFSRVGAEVHTAANGKIGLQQFYSLRPDLVILDIMMPETDGWETCQQIRLLSNVPIIMLTALDQDLDVIRGLDLGADEFVSKPFSSRVMLARARAALRRADLSPEERALALRYDDGFLSIDIEQRKVIIAGETIKLTPKEYRLLAYLLQNAGRVRTSEQILENVWGYAYQDSIDYVHVYISHLRRKLEKDPKDPKYLVTEHGIGYRFEKDKGG